MIDACVNPSNQSIDLDMIMIGFHVEHVRVDFESSVVNFDESW